MTDIAARLADDPPPRTDRVRSAGTWAILARSATRTRSRRCMFIKGLGRARPLLHRVVAGHQQQADRQPIALRRADVGADTRSDAHRPTGHDGRQSRCVAWQLPHRAADQGPHARHRQARRARRGRSIRAAPRPPRQFEWLGIVPDTDAFLLLSLLQVMFADDLVDTAPGEPAGRRHRLAASAVRTVHSGGRPQPQTGIDAGQRARRWRATWSARRGPPSTAGSVPASADTAR